MPERGPGDLRRRVSGPAPPCTSRPSAITTGEGWAGAGARTVPLVFGVVHQLVQLRSRVLVLLRLRLMLLEVLLVARLVVVILLAALLVVVILLPVLLLHRLGAEIPVRIATPVVHHGGVPTAGAARPCAGRTTGASSWLKGGILA